MAELLPVSEKVVDFQSRGYKFSKIAYDGTAVTFKVDQSAVGVVTTLPVSGAPAVTLSAADGNFEKTVTLASGSSRDTVIVVTVHGRTLTGANT